jgi:hypothetical protein
MSRNLEELLETIIEASELEKLEKHLRRHRRCDAVAGRFAVPQFFTPTGVCLMANVAILGDSIATFSLLFTNATGASVNGPSDGVVTLDNAALGTVGAVQIAADGSQSVAVTPASGVATDGSVTGTLTYTGTNAAGAKVTFSQGIVVTADTNAVAGSFGKPVFTPILASTPPASGAPAA